MGLPRQAGITLLTAVAVFLAFLPLSSRAEPARQQGGDAALVAEPVKGVPSGSGDQDYSGAVDVAQRIWVGVQSSISESYARAPALVLGLAVLLAVPPLAVVGLVLRSSRRREDEASPAGSTELIKRGGRAFGSLGLIETSSTSSSADGRVWRSQAFVDVVGVANGRHPVGRGMVRIGREDDNDICLTQRTIHRYHAVIHRTDDAEYLITDLAGAEGNGTFVNGQRVSQAPLKDGDTVALGEVMLRFDVTAA